MYDLYIHNATIVDGTGRKRYRAHVGVTCGKIVEIGAVPKKQAKRIIDAEGKVLAPGFIDMHSHSDTMILVNPEAESKINQGVTTEVIGNCGNSLAPLAGESLTFVDDHLVEYDLKRTWASVEQYLAAVEAARPALNMAMLAGHGTIRRNILGTANRAPKPSEMEDMEKILKKALLQGAFGMSTGLIYPPGFYGDTSELISLGRVLKKHRGLYASHIRGEGPTLLKAMEEIIAIGQNSRCPVHVSHHKAIGKEQWGKVEKTLTMIDEARSKGIDITGDVYPYEATNTLLQTFLPRWVHEGGVETMLNRLDQEDTVSKIKERFTSGRHRHRSWENVVVSNAPCHPAWEGEDLSTIAKSKNQDVPSTIIDIIAGESGKASVIIFQISEDDICRVLQHPAMMIGSDGSALTMAGKFVNGKPHPRNFGTFPRVLKRYVKNEKVLSLEEAINKMTFMPAKRLGLSKRGLVLPGYYADLVLFDPDQIDDCSDYQNPRQCPMGIDYVMVHGNVAVEKSNFTGIFEGRVLRRK